MRGELARSSRVDELCGFYGYTTYVIQEVHPLKIQNIKLSPKHPRVEAINVTKVLSREFAEWIRELEDDKEFERIEGRFAVYRTKGRTVYLELEF